jgi:hypothetical protein
MHITVVARVSTCVKDNEERQFTPTSWLSFGGRSENYNHPSVNTAVGKYDIRILAEAARNDNVQRQPPVAKTLFRDMAIDRPTAHVRPIFPTSS